MIRIGRCSYDGEYSSYEGFTPILTTSKSGLYSDLSPFHLKMEKGYIMENIWQFLKVYEEVYRTDQPYSSWKHGSEKHISSDGKLTNEYWRWMLKGFHHRSAVRYPNDRHRKTKVLYSLCPCDSGQITDPDGNRYKKLDYIEARKQIYVPIYSNLVIQTSSFRLLKERLQNGENLLLIDYDGPHQQSLSYYMKKYRVKSNFIEKGSLLLTEESYELMLNDDKHPFGHSYVLGKCLLDKNF